MGADGSYGRPLDDCAFGLGPSEGVVDGSEIGGARVVPTPGTSPDPCRAEPFVLAGCGGAVESLS